MLMTLNLLLAALGRCFRSRASMQVENLALRHQLAVLRRSTQKCPRLGNSDRLLWILISRFFSDWHKVLVIVKPETVLAWHLGKVASKAVLVSRRQIPTNEWSTAPMMSISCRDLDG